MNHDQDLCLNLWYDPKKLLWQDELNPRVRCAFGNVYFFRVDFDWLILLLWGWLLPVWGSCKSTSKILPWGLCTRLASLILRSTYNTCKELWKWKWWDVFNYSTDQLTLLRKLHSSGVKLRDQAALETSFELLSMLYFLHTSTTYKLFVFFH